MNNVHPIIILDRFVLTVKTSKSYLLKGKRGCSDVATSMFFETFSLNDVIFTVIFTPNRTYFP